MPVNEDSFAKCIFCGKGNQNQLIYGPLCSTKKVSAHYFCILLSSKLLQRGKDDEGIYGFLVCDILKEYRRCKQIKCSFCGKKGANINCYQDKCDIVFHLPCGIQNKTVHQFTDCFLSYCSKHGNVEKCDKKEIEAWKKNGKTCGICLETIHFNMRDKCNKAPCCLDNWFHKICLQELANNAGYFFKCPICNNKSNFVSYMMNHSIFVPKRDASWELEPGAFQDLLFKYEKCDAAVCKCPMGRQKNIDNSKWEVTLCKTCGSQGIHIECGNLKNAKLRWECDFCKKVVQKYRRSKYKSQKDVDKKCSPNSFDNVNTVEKKRKSGSSHCRNSKRQKVDTIENLQNGMSSLTVSSMNNISQCKDSPRGSSEEKDYIEIVLTSSDEESHDSDIQVITEINQKEKKSCDDGFVECIKKPILEENLSSSRRKSKTVLKKDKETDSSPPRTFDSLELLRFPNLLDTIFSLNEIKPNHKNFFLQN